MAPPVDLFEVIGKKCKGTSNSQNKGRSKQGVQPKKSRRAIFEVIAPEKPDQGKELRSAPLADQSRLPEIEEQVETVQVEERENRPKRARVVTEQTDLPGLSSSDEI